MAESGDGSGTLGLLRDGEPVGLPIGLVLPTSCSFLAVRAAPRGRGGPPRGGGVSAVGVRRVVLAGPRVERLRPAGGAQLRGLCGARSLAHKKLLTYRFKHYVP